MEKFFASPQKWRGGAHKFIKKATVTVLVTVILTVAGAGGALAATRELVPVGRAVGIRLENAGVVITGIPDTCADGNSASPAKASGLRTGDIITRVGNTDISCNEDLRKIVTESGGRALTLHVLRDGKAAQAEVMPHMAGDGLYSLGLMIRDGVSGIGTVTFYDPASGAFGALGHAVNDSDTGVQMPVRVGFISQLEVTGVEKGKAGAPGQLRGGFDFEKKLGEIKRNTALGIYGNLTSRDFISEAPVPVADESDIHTGEAYILSNIAGNIVKRYSAEVSRVFSGREADGRSMLITITDPALRDATGGIVQGMSGSPIIQDGKIIGAVTHVLVNDPAKGYGISIARMLDCIDGMEADGVSVAA